jgi:DUF438 domain-containing protein
MYNPKEAVLDSTEIVNMFDNLGVSMAIIDKNFTMIYQNKKGREFYLNAFKADNLVGKNVEFCHAQKNIDNIRELMGKFEHEERPLNFFKVALPVFEGGHLTVVHFPYFKDNKFVGILEINIESSLTAGGRGQYEHH